MAIWDRWRKTPPPTEPRGTVGRATLAGLPPPDLEHVPELQHPWGHRVWDRMWRSDPDIRRVVRMVVAPILAATWQVHPAGGDDATDVDREAAELAEWALWEFMRPALPEHLAEALPVLVRSGFAPFEHVWASAKWRGRTVQVPATLQLRLPRTITRFFTDQLGQLVEVEQQPDSGPPVRIPAQNLVWYRVGGEGDQWVGESMLRPAYKPWLIKDRLERLDAIAAEREATGIPVVYPPLAGEIDPQQLDRLEELLAQIRAGEVGYLVMPGPHAADLGGTDAGRGWRFELVGFGGSQRGRDLRPSLEYHVDRIAAAFVAEFMRLGQGEVGARATAEIQQNPFLASVEALATLVERTLQDAIVDRIAALNYGGRIEEPPTLRMQLVDATSLTELAQYVAQLVDKGVLTPDERLEEWLRDRADLPPPDRAAQPAAKPPAEQQQQQEEMGQTLDRVQLQQQPAPLPSERPDLRWWERLAMLDAIQQVADTARTRVEQATNQVVAQRVAPAAARAALKGDPTPPKPDPQLVEALTGALDGLYRLGRATVRQELAQQRAGNTNIAPLPLLALDDPRQPDEQVPEGVRLRAELAASEITQRAWQAAHQQRLNTGADQAGVQLAAEQAAKRAVRDQAQQHAMAVLNQGRADEAERHADEIQAVYYTSVLDSSTCAACEAADDNVPRTLDDPVRLARRPPNPQCAGGPRCRCVEVYVLRDEPAPRG